MPRHRTVITIILTVIVVMGAILIVLEGEMDLGQKSLKMMSMRATKFSSSRA